MCTHFLSQFTIVLDHILPFVVFLICVSLMDSTSRSRMIEESNERSQCQSGSSRHNDDEDSNTANKCSTSNTATSSSFSNTATSSSFSNTAYKCSNRNTASGSGDSHKGDTQAHKAGPKDKIKNPVSFSRSSHDRDPSDSSNSSEQSDRDASRSDSDSDSPAERQEFRFRRRPMVHTGAHSRELTNESSAERPRKRARTEIEQERDEYKPFSLSEKDDGTWKLPENCVDYASPFFRDYHTESELKPLLESNPRPEHSFLKIEKIDSSVKQGLKAKCGKLGKVTLERDKRLRSIHEKIVRASGPMGRIWETLDGTRKANSEKKVDLAKLLENIEQSFLLLGQAVVACRWHRRLEITTAITKSKRDSKELLHTYDNYLDDEEFLFGKRYLKKVEKEEAKKPTDKGLFVVLNPVKKPNARHSKFQNPSFRHFQSQDTNQPFRQGPRMEGGDRRGQKTKRGGIRGRARGSSHPGRYVILSFNKETGKRQTTPGSRSKEFKGANVMSGNISNPLQATDGFGSKTPTKKPNSNRGKGKISNKKLGKTHKRSSSPPISSRLPNSILSASTDRQTNKPKVFSKGERVNIHRSERDVEERCNQTGGTQNRPICGPHIPQGEERWGTEASVQPEETECFRGIQALQDGRPAHGENCTAGK